MEEFIAFLQRLIRIKIFSNSTFELYNLSITIFMCWLDLRCNRAIQRAIDGSSGSISKERPGTMSGHFKLWFYDEDIA